MGFPRSKYIQDEEEGVYHCVSRCVRRAFLCGYDAATGRDYSHRKVWVVDRLRHLASIFAVEVCAYAVMDTHHHSILRTRPDIVARWSDREVAARWIRLFPRQGRRKGKEGSAIEEQISALTACPLRITVLRKRLCSLSWFMGQLNEFIARAANKEDGVKGRFWESRFKCQVLLDDAATVACMVYVDLNLVRSGMAATPELSDFTSIQERIRLWQKQTVAGTEDYRDTGCDTEPMQSLRYSPAPSNDDSCDSWLCPIESNSERRGILQMTSAEYFDLLDKSGRVVRSDKRGSIDADLAPILCRINANPGAWIDTISFFDARFCLAAGLPASLRNYAIKMGRHWLKGVTVARAVFT